MEEYVKKVNLRLPDTAYKILALLVVDILGIPIFFFLPQFYSYLIMWIVLYSITIVGYVQMVIKQTIKKYFKKLIDLMIEETENIKLDRIIYYLIGITWFFGATITGISAILPIFILYYAKTLSFGNALFLASILILILSIFYIGVDFFGNILLYKTGVKSQWLINALLVIALFGGYLLYIGVVNDFSVVSQMPLNATLQNTNITGEITSQANVWADSTAIGTTIIGIAVSFLITKLDDIYKKKEKP